MTYKKKKVIIKQPNGKAAEEADCDRYLFNLFDNDITYILQTLKSLEYRATAKETSPCKTVSTKAFEKSFSLDAIATSLTPQYWEENLKCYEDRISVLQGGEIYKYQKRKSGMGGLTQ